MELLETTYSDRSVKVDEEAGIIRGVKILGRESAHNRVYTDPALHQAAKLYEGIKVHIDHPPRANPDTERGFNEGLGELRNVSVKPGDGVYGDLHYLKSHPSSGPLVEAAQRMPAFMGLSHNAGGDGKRGADGKFHVESIDVVRSVDLVGKGATTKSLFESEGTPMKTKTVKQILESSGPVTTNKWHTVLREVADAGMVAPEMEVDAEPDPAAEVKAALEKAAVAVVKKLFAGDIDEAAAMAEIKKILGMRDEAAGDESETPAEGGGGESMESLATVKAELDKLKKAHELRESESRIRRQIDEAKKTATDNQVAAIMNLRESDAADFISLLPDREPAVRRPMYSLPATTGPEQLTESIPTEGKKFAELVR